MSKNQEKSKLLHRWLILISLIVAGEIIFGLPFHIARFFRPTFLMVFKLNNAQLGDAIAVYGVTAMLSYFPGGVIADRFSPRKLMSLSLFATALGGLVLAQIPGLQVLSVLFGFWGVTTILLFWSAMLRVTRNWGGKLSQGKAFGLLDGGRGFVAAGVATIGVFLLQLYLPRNANVIPPENRENALVAIILMYTLFTAAAGIFIWIVVPDEHNKTDTVSVFKGIKQVLNRRETWLQALVVVCAYCGYKGLDFYAQYSMVVLGKSEVEASQFVSAAGYIRPVAAIGAGFIADRFSSKKTIFAMFCTAFAGYILLIFLTTHNPAANFIYFQLILTFVAVYALRGVYFALFEEIRVPQNITGTTIGVVSLIGFTPDIFFNSIAGRIIDYNPGIDGFQNFFMMMAGFVFIGLLSAILLLKQKSVMH